MLARMRSVRILRLIGSAAIAIGCAHDTTELVCPPIECTLTRPIAVRVQVVSAATGAPVDSLSMQAAGPALGGGSCSGNVCIVAGYGGEYQLTISAPGYQSAHLDVTVHQTPPPKCGCQGVTTEQRTVALVPVAGQA